MPLPVSLKSVADEMDACPSEWALFINRKTGELVSIPNEPDWSEDEPTRDWEQEQQADIERVQGSDDFIALPDKYEIHEYAIMERFASSVADEKTRKALLVALRGRGAFRRFKDMVAELGVRESWFDYKARALSRITADFLEAEGIAYVDDVGLK